MSLPSPTRHIYNGCQKRRCAMDDSIQPIRQDRLDGMTYKAIAEKYHIDPRTAKRYAQKNLPLSQLEQRPFSSILDPYKPFIDEVLSDAPVPAATIFNWIVEQGYTGKYRIVAEYVRNATSTLERDILTAGQTLRAATTSSEPLNIEMKSEKEFQHVSGLK